jgi:hypothetical protein
MSKLSLVSFNTKYVSSVKTSQKNYIDSDLYLFVLCTCECFALHTHMYFLLQIIFQELEILFTIFQEIYNEMSTLISNGEVVLLIIR